ncbi:DUF4430 domain-containing protein [Acetobacterium bakii]|uniref:Transcobalamin-like C-terminal domain-containing protein n=1 Tax=Acetobacterium bakii TaxID=52689 RepID=A0A0L6TY07_9FIRM|nr:DUF4430 domain-containing protein [Acetobacterium bakii]KNZ41159.1 hypothetical protein AKG39_13915 [Acetobacterium bakii]
MKKGFQKKQFLLLIMLILMALTTIGCSNISAAVAGDTESQDVVELAEDTPIPEDGIITAAQFRSIAGQDRTVTFSGTSGNGINYVWSFNGQDIKNPADQNLKIDFTTQGDTLNSVKAGAGNAPYGFGMKIAGNNGLITVPTLTVTLSEKWDADSAALCKISAGSIAKMSTATFDNLAETTRLSFKVIETGDDYFVVAGKTIAPIQSAGTGTGTEATTASNGSTITSDGGTVSGAVGNTCTLSINCATLLNHMDVLPAGKAGFVPANGWILYSTQVPFTEGETVHDVLQRVCRENGIHMESSFTPAYNSAYVEGINQLYEFDGGELSGWMYNVNGWFPNYGCSQYTLKNGDAINWVYTCDLGKDVGDNSMW